jgi:hypothetical protein
MTMRPGPDGKFKPPAPPQTQAARPPVRIIPDDAVFRLGELQAVLGLANNTLRREARLGRLRVAKRSGQLWTLGRWVKEWLAAGEVRRGRDSGGRAPA